MYAICFCFTYILNNFFDFIHLFVIKFSFIVYLKKEGFVALYNNKFDMIRVH